MYEINILKSIKHSIKVYSINFPRVKELERERERERERRKGDREREREKRDYNSNFNLISF